MPLEDEARLDQSNGPSSCSCWREGAYCWCSCQCRVGLSSCAERRPSSSPPSFFLSLSLLVLLLFPFPFLFLLSFSFHSLNCLSSIISASALAQASEADQNQRRDFIQHARKPAGGEGALQAYNSFAGLPFAQASFTGTQHQQVEGITGLLSTPDTLL